MSTQAPPANDRPAWAQLKSWEEYTRELNIPGELGMALATNRPELLDAAHREMSRTHTAEDVLTLFEVIRVLMETNWALQQHAAQVAERAANMRDAFDALDITTAKLKALAEFEEYDA